MNSTNLTNSSSIEFWFHDKGWNWYMWKIFVWLFPLMCLLGAIANICSFIVIATNRKSFPYVTRQYLLIITMSDFFTLTVTAFTHYAFYMTYLVNQSNGSSWYLISIKWIPVYEFVFYYSAVGSPFFQLGLTVDRLVAVAAPMRAKMILSHRRSWILLAIISGMALLLPIMYVACCNCCSNSSTEFQQNMYLHMELWYGRVFLITLLMLGSIAISLLLGRSNRAAGMIQADAAAASVQEQNLRQRRKRLVRISLMLIFINVIFSITALPWSITMIVFRSRLMKGCMNSPFLCILLGYFQTLLYVNNALGWPVYFLGHTFRQAFYKTFVPACLRGARGRNDMAVAAAAAGLLQDNRNPAK